MKKIIMLFMVLGLCVTSANSQSLLKGLGEKALQAATKGASNAVSNQVTKRAEAKASNAINNAINNAFGEVKKDTVSQDAIDNINGMAEAMSGLGAATAAYSNAMMQGMNAAAANIKLRDFSEQNAERAKHNETLEFDKWDE